MLTTAMLTKLADLRGGRRVAFFIATNRLTALDAAVTRPGRFDLQLFVGTPNLPGERGVRTATTAPLCSFNDAPFAPLSPPPCVRTARLGRFRTKLDALRPPVEDAEQHAAVARGVAASCSAGGICRRGGARQPGAAAASPGGARCDAERRGLGCLLAGCRADPE